jgi:hypothetical protein
MMPKTQQLRLWFWLERCKMLLWGWAIIYMQFISPLIHAVCKNICVKVSGRQQQQRQQQGSAITIRLLTSV